MWDNVLLEKLAQMHAGDYFDSIEEAAISWALHYADDSIAENSEFGSAIYAEKVGKQIKYSYNIPAKGYPKDVNVNTKVNKKQTIVSSIHSHGSYFSDNDDYPSDMDIENCFGEEDFVVTPLGNLKGFTKDGKVRLIRNDLKKDAMVNTDFFSTNNFSTKSNYQYIKDERLSGRK